MHADATKKGDSRSSIVDSPITLVVGGKREGELQV